MNNTELKNYVEKYRHKAKVLKIIHSDKAEKKRARDLRFTIATIVLGAAISFLGFMGSERVLSVFQWGIAHATNEPLSASATTTERQKITPPVEFNETAKSRFDFGVNAAVQALFILSILNLIYRWKEDATSHFQGVVRLTQYINWLDELSLIGLNPSDLMLTKEIRSRYQNIVESLLPNNDEDYEKAKAKLNDPPVLPSESTMRCRPDEALVIAMIEKSPIILEILRTISRIDSRLWLGGGAIRNRVWDELTGRTSLNDDFDVVYFDQTDTSTFQDGQIEFIVRKDLAMALKISVKNQARMHSQNGEPPRTSLENAIENWPETATALAARIAEDGQIELIAPYGLRDLLSLIVRPTPYHEAQSASYDKRKLQKNWSSHWPELTVK